MMIFLPVYNSFHLEIPYEKNSLSAVFSALCFRLPKNVAEKGAASHGLL